MRIVRFIVEEPLTKTSADETIFVGGESGGGAGQCANAWWRLSFRELYEDLEQFLGDSTDERWELPFEQTLWPTFTFKIAKLFDIQL